MMRQNHYLYLDERIKIRLDYLEFIPKYLLGFHLLAILKKIKPILF
jgi:hypothetical protein